LIATRDAQKLRRFVFRVKLTRMLPLHEHVFNWRRCWVSFPACKAGRCIGQVARPSEEPPLSHRHVGQSVGALSHGSMRYSQIFSLLDNVSQRMLALTLKGLERDGLSTRTVCSTTPTCAD
jgi:hypothetical protein